MSIQAAAVKVYMINGVGPIIGTAQMDTMDHLVLSNVAQFATDENGDVTIIGYLEALATDDNVCFMKYNIVSISTPNDVILGAYLGAFEDETPKVFVPENKIII